jgi:hypothetical protein
MAGKPKRENPQPKGKPKGAKPQKSKATVISFKESDIVQRWLVTTEGCPTCEEIKRDFKKDFKSGKIKATDVGDDKGFEIITDLGIDEVPLFIVELRADHPSGIKYIIDE